MPTAKSPPTVRLIVEDIPDLTKAEIMITETAHTGCVLFFGAHRLELNTRVKNTRFRYDPVKKEIIQISSGGDDSPDEPLKPDKPEGPDFDDLEFE